MRKTPTLNRKPSNAWLATEKIDINAGTPPPVATLWKEEENKRREEKERREFEACQRRWTREALKREEACYERENDTQDARTERDILYMQGEQVQFI